jgi:hypothetical protein
MPKNSASPYDRAHWGGRVGMLRREGSDPVELAEAESSLATGQAEAALARALAKAPPLRPEQIGYLRSVLDTYAESSTNAVVA